MAALKIHNLPLFRDVVAREMETMGAIEAVRYAVYRYEGLDSEGSQLTTCGGVPCYNCPINCVTLVDDPEYELTPVKREQLITLFRIGEVEIEGYK